MKREEFLAPEIEVVNFSAVDAILTASVDPNDPFELPDI